MRSSSRTAFVYLCFALVWGAAHTAILIAQDDHGAQDSQDSQNDQDTSEPLHYADQSTPRNHMVIDVNGAAAYDDNVYSDNANRVGSPVFQGGAHIGLNETGERSALTIDYLPEFLAYTNVSGYNQADQNLRFNAKYDVTRHFELRFNDGAQYFTGIYSPRLNGNTAPEGTEIGGLNNTVFTPLARDFSNEGRVDAVYQWSRRSSFDFFGGVGTRNFSGNSNPEENLFNTQAYTGGLTYTYRLTADSSFGVSAMHQNLGYGESHDEIETPLLSFNWEGKSGVNVGVYGGPQYVRQNDTIYYPIVSGKITSYDLRRNAEEKWEGGGGANLGWRSDRTVVEASAQRLTADGGGIFTSVVNTTESFDLRRHLTRQWDLLIAVQDAQSKALSPVFGGAGVDSQVGSLKLQRQLSSNLVAQIGYEAARQRVIGSFPYLVDMNRNYLSLGFFYRLGRIPMGR